MQTNETPYDIFIKNFPPNEEGKTDYIPIEKLVAISDKFKSNNGCQWARKGSKLDKQFIIKRYHANEKGGKGNAVVGIQLLGFKNEIQNHSIPLSVRKALKGKPCVVLNIITTDMEIDHKNARYNKEELDINDFQPMCKAVNDAKREHCKKCLSTGIRFDATVLGFNKSYIYGNAKSNECNGCFWYDPIEFRRIENV